MMRTTTTGRAAAPSTMMETSSSSSNDHHPLLLSPPGFRFYPTEEELLTFYLRHLLAGTRRPAVEHLIPVVDIYGQHPSELRAMSGAANVGDADQWFFFCPRAEREIHGGRPARTTPSGYWKATGSPSFVFSNSNNTAGGGGGGGNRVIGEKRTMVFYQGRAPTGNKTRWKMNEYKAVVADADADDSFATPPPAMAPAGAGPPIMLRNEFSVCRVYISTGTLRSFDRRPLNPPPPVVGSSLAGVHCGYQQQQLQPLLLPPAPLAVAVAVAAAKTTTSHHQQQQQMLVAVVVDDDAARRRAAEKSHDSSSSVTQEGGGVDDGAEEDAAMAIDWDSLISPVDDPAFSGVDDLTRVIWPHN